MSPIGRWRNAYGSLLDIHNHGANGELTGFYSSDTGASGCYPVTGWSPPCQTGQLNRPFAICVQWRPLASDAEDPSWTWCSMMSGALFFDTPSGSAQIQVLHGLVASGPFGEVGVERPGVYTETLTFDPVSDVETKRTLASTKRDAELRAPERMVFRNRSQLSTIRNIGLVITPDGRVKAELVTSSGPALGVGFADPTPKSRFRSLTLCVVAGREGKRSLALGGFIGMQEGAVRLQRFDSEARKFRNKYTAVSVGQEEFSASPTARCTDE